MTSCAFLHVLLLYICTIFYSSEAEILTCNQCTELKNVNPVNGEETVTYYDLSGNKLDKCGKKACAEVSDKCYKLTHTPSSEEEKSTSAHFGCGSDKDKVCDVVEGLQDQKEECKAKFEWEVCSVELCNKPDSDTDEHELICYHCTKSETTDTGDKTITIMKFNTGDKIESCEKINCSQASDKCYKLTTKPSSEEETSTSIHMSCGSSKKQACNEVGKLQVDKCNSDWTWETCDEELCNKSQGVTLRPMILLITLVSMPAFISHII